MSLARGYGFQGQEHNDEWSLKRRYMQLEGQQTLSDTVPTRLSAVPR
jgi:putative transposase